MVFESELELFVQHCESAWLLYTKHMQVYYLLYLSIQCPSELALAPHV